MALPEGLKLDLTIDFDEPPEEPPKKKKPTKAEKRAAKKLLAEEAKKQHRRDHLERELKQSEANWDVIKAEFKDMVQAMRLPEMKDDTMTVWHTFDRTIDLKNCLISRLVDFLDETDEQYRINQQSHVEMIDNLIQYFSDQLDQLRDNYMTRLSDSKNEESGLQGTLQSTNTTQVGQLQAIMYAMDKSFQDFMTNYKSDSMAKIDDEINKFQELSQNLRVELERFMEYLWNTLKSTLTNYTDSTEETRIQYEQLRVADIYMTQELHRQVARTQKLYDTIRNLKDELLEKRDIMATELGDLACQRQYYLEKLMAMRAQLKVKRQFDHNQLITLTAESNATIRWLQNLVNKGERILKIAAICRKLETQREKVVPYPNLPITSAIEDEESERRVSDPMIQVYDDFKTLVSSGSELEMLISNEWKWCNIMTYYY